MYCTSILALSSAASADDCQDAADTDCDLLSSSAVIIDVKMLLMCHSTCALTTIADGRDRPGAAVAGYRSRCCLTTSYSSYSRTSRCYKAGQFPTLFVQPCAPGNKKRGCTRATIRPLGKQ